MAINPENKRLILSLKNADDTMTTAAGVSIEIDYILSPVLHGGENLKGQIVCVPKNRLIKIPVDNSWEYSCFESDVIYSKIDVNNPKDSSY